jgi:DNA-binding SARP family transcriptional activator
VTRPGLADSLDGITMPPRRWRYVSATLPDQSPLRTHVRLCGRLSIEIDGREVVGRMRGRQVPLLAVYLLLHRARAIARDELELALWPDSAPRSQDAALRTLLSRLRSALGADAVSGRDGILLRLPEPVWIDLEAAGAHVVAARSALGLDDPRAAVTAAQTAQDIAARGLLPGAQAVWLEGPRRELADLQVQALELIGQAGLRLGAGELSTVQRAGRTLVELEPYRESGYVLLMRVLAAQGNLAEGLWVYDQLRSLLRDELGVAPSAEAIAVHEGLLGVGAPGDHTEGEPAGEPIELPAAMRMAAAAPLVGREAELSAMRAWWRAGTERIFMLDGEPGTGKSRLLAALAGDAHGAGAVVLAGHAHEEMLAPYESFLQAIGQYVDGAPLGQLRAVVHRSGTAAAEVARLVPELRRRLGDLPASAPDDPETDRYRLFEAVAALLGELAEQSRLLLVFDDLQWAGRPSMLLLRHLARSPRAARIRVLVAYRTGEQTTPDLGAPLSPLRRDGLMRRLQIDGLAPDGAAALVRARVGGTPSAALQEALYDLTGGNPFFIEELVRHLAESGVAPRAAGLADLRRAGLPDDVRDLIARRLTRLSDDGREWLRDAAVIGRDFDASLLEQVLGFDERRFLDALDEALAARLVLETPGTPGRYLFSHALVRETLYTSMSSARRARTHLRVGRALERRGQTDREVAALAHHFTRAGGGGDGADGDGDGVGARAITYALAAGAQAGEVLAHEEAAGHYAHALEVLSRGDRVDPRRHVEVLLALAEARLRGGERAAAWTAFAQAADLAEADGDPASLIRAALGASQRFIQPPGVVDDELIALLDRALEATVGQRTVTRVRLLAQLCATIYFSPRRAQMPRLSAEATSIAAELGDPEAAALAASARRRAWWGPGHPERRLADSTLVLRFARQAGEPELALQGHAWLVVDLLEAGDRSAVEAQVEAFVTGAQTLRQPLYTWNVLVWRAMLALLDGRLDEAERLAEEAVSFGIRPDGVAASQYHLLQLLAIRREQMRTRELEQLLREVSAARPGLVAWRSALALVLSDTGRPELARNELEALVGPEAPEMPTDGDWLPVTALQAELACELGDAERASILFDRLAPHVQTIVVFGMGAVCWGALARHLGRLALVIGRREQGLALLEQAVAANRSLRAWVLLAHAELDLACALGAGERARELASAAAATASQRELPLLAHRAAATLRGL